MLLQELLDSIELPPENVTTIDDPINLSRLMSAYDLIDQPDQKFAPLIPYVHPDLESPERLFEQIAQKDYLLHQPYDGFQPFIDFLQRAATDPQVFAIKQTLYRTSGDSPIVQSLMEASRTTSRSRYWSRSKHALMKPTISSGPANSRMSACTWSV